MDTGIGSIESIGIKLASYTTACQASGTLPVEVRLFATQSGVCLFAAFFRVLVHTAKMASCVPKRVAVNGSLTLKGCFMTTML